MCICIAYYCVVRGAVCVQCMWYGMECACVGGYVVQTICSLWHKNSMWYVYSMHMCGIYVACIVLYAQHVAYM